MRHFCLLFLILFSGACFSQDVITIRLNPTPTHIRIPSDFTGLSFEKNSLNKGSFGLHRDTLATLFKTCGIKSLRVGANSVDTDQLGNVATDTSFTRAQLDSLYLFAQKANCTIYMGLNLGGDFNPSRANTEASYVLDKYSDVLYGFEFGNEPDRYSGKHHHKDYTVKDYISQFNVYRDTIRKHHPKAVFTGPGSADNFRGFTLPFCDHMNGKISMLTQHYYVAGKSSTITPHEQMVTMLSREKLSSISAEADTLVKHAARRGMIFRISECNSFYNGGQPDVSDAFASALWALNFMYEMAKDSCAGVNFHGGLSGTYNIFSLEDNIYHARPIAYGILAFQVGSNGRFIPSDVTGNNINLDSYSVIDDSNYIFTTIINKEFSGSAVIDIVANSNYPGAEYITLSAPSLESKESVRLGGKEVNSTGTIPAYTWIPLPVSLNTTQITVHPGSAVVVKFIPKIGISINEYPEKNKHLLNIYPNPAYEKVTVKTDIAEHATISIYGLQGHILLQQQIKQGETDIDISKLAKGVYVLRLNSNDNTEVSRLIKE